MNFMIHRADIKCLRLCATAGTRTCPTEIKYCKYQPSGVCARQCQFKKVSLIFNKALELEINL